MSQRYAMPAAELSNLATETHRELNALLSRGQEGQQSILETRAQTIGLILEDAIDGLSLHDLLERREKLMVAVGKIDAAISARMGDASGGGVALALADPVGFCVKHRITSPAQLGTHLKAPALVAEVDRAFAAKDLPVLTYSPPSAQTILAELRRCGNDIGAVKRYIVQLHTQAIVALAPFLPKKKALT